MAPEPSAADIYGRDFPAGAVIFEEGDPGSRMYVIRTGEVRILKRVGAREITLARLGPGEAFGEMALLEDQPRSATAIVEAPARILEIEEGAFADLVRHNGEIALRLLRRLSARLREANRQLRNFLSADALGRAVEVLRALAAAPGEDGFRAIPAEIGPGGLAERAGAPGSDAPSPALLRGAAEVRGQALWQRLRRARLVREVGDRAELAPAEVVDAFLRYLDLRARYHAFAVTELSEAPDALGGADGIAQELLHARLAAEGGIADARTSAELEDYLALRRRFEPDEAAAADEARAARQGKTGSPT